MAGVHTRSGMSWLVLCATRVSARLAGAALLGSLATLACSGSDPSEATACVVNKGVIAQAIINGAEREQFLGLGDEQAAAIVAIDDVPWPNGSLCTGVLLRRNWVLTAAHCLVIDNPLVHIRQTPARVMTSRVSREIAHPDLDVALLEVDPPADGVQFPSIPGQLSDRDWLGRQVEVAGYGLTEANAPKGLRFAVEPIVELTDSKLRIDGSGRSGACEGDSGGPLLARGSDGSVLVLGTLSAGQATCVGRDSFVRADSLGDWLAANLPSADPAGGVPCGQISASGSCSYGSALHCVDGALQVEACASDQRCGWDMGANRFGCVAADADPCQGAGSLGVCDGDQAVTCVRGNRVTTDCAACGTCQYATGTGAPQCVAHAP